VAHHRYFMVQVTLGIDPTSPSRKGRGRARRSKPDLDDVIRKLQSRLTKMDIGGYVIRDVIVGGVIPGDKAIRALL
jgi:hypothetical protein